MNYNYPSTINKYMTNHKWSLRKKFLLSSNKLNGTLPDCLGETHWQFTPVLGTCKHDQDYMDRWATWPTGTLHLSTSHIQVVTQTEKAKYWFKECCCSRKPSQSDTRKKKLWEVVLIVYWLCGLLKYPYYKCDNWLFIKKIIARIYLQMFTFFQVLK